MIRLLTLILCFAFQSAVAQQFIKWLDDDHYILRTEENGDLQHWKVDPATGDRDTIDGPDTWTREQFFMRGTRMDDQSPVQLRNGDIFAFDKKITNTAALEQNPTISPNEKWVAYTRGGNLFAYDLEHERTTRLTDDGTELILNGYASWVYYEEILGRSSRYRSFYWSPDSKYIAFLKFDDHPVPEFTISRSEDVHGNQEKRRYPKPGDPNPEVQIGIVDVETHEISWVEEDAQRDQYTAWCMWTPDSKSLLFQELNREQDTLDLIRYDVADQSRHRILREVQPTWVAFMETIHFVNNGKEILLPSSRSGWKNWYHYDLEGKLINPIAEKPWNYELSLVEKNPDLLVLSGASDDPTGKQTWTVKLNGDDLKQLSREEGYTRTEVSPSGKYFFLETSTVRLPATTRIVSADGDLLQDIYTPDETTDNEIQVEKFKVPTDGYELPGIIIYPKGFDAQKEYPVLFSVYGGPDAEAVNDRYRSWSDDFMVNNGIIRIAVDHRGSGKFGKRGLDELHRSLGTHEIDDLIEVVKWLYEKPYVDRNRIGITGGSYGGYVTAMALTYGAEYFTHGISLFPVTDWRLYDNVYTERYMDRPEQNTGGYIQASAMTHAEKLKGKLLLVHGMADDNVHAQNTMQLISKFQKLGKEFELMVYPGKRHGWRGPERGHLTKLTEGFWTRHFLE